MSGKTSKGWSKRKFSGEWAKALQNYLQKKVDEVPPGWVRSEEALRKMGYAGDAGTVHELIISPDAKFFETSPQEIAQWLKKKERELFPLVQEQQMFADAKKGAVQLDEITKKNINVSQQAKEEYGKWLKTNGYDGYSMKRENGIEYAVINKDKIKTRSQLIDIWNKAQNINSRQ